MSVLYSAEDLEERKRKLAIELGNTLKFARRTERIAGELMKSAKLTEAAENYSKLVVLIARANALFDALLSMDPMIANEGMRFGLGEINWDAINTMWYTEGMTRDKICKEHGVSMWMLTHQGQVYGWKEIPHGF